VLPKPGLAPVEIATEDNFNNQIVPYNEFPPRCRICPALPGANFNQYYRSSGFNARAILRQPTSSSIAGNWRGNESKPDMLEEHQKALRKYFTQVQRTRNSEADLLVRRIRSKCPSSFYLCVDVRHFSWI
jgi:hypothetical protein